MLVFYQIKTTRADTNKTRQDIGTETDWEWIDSGCSSLRHSRSSSVTTDLEESHNQKSDFGVNTEIKHSTTKLPLNLAAKLINYFQNEKIYETQQKLHALMSQVQGTSSKSLLIQTVALFEALLTRIKDLQAENEKLKTVQLSDETNKEAIRAASDEMVLEIETLNARNLELSRSKEETLSRVSLLECEVERLTQQLREKDTDLSRREETQRKLSSMQVKVEEDLKREVTSLSQKLNSTILGSRAESEMYEQSLLKVSILERSMMSLQQSISELQSENNQLRDQLSVALEHHTNKSQGSLGSEFGVNKSGSFSGPDLSDGTTQGSNSSGVWSVTSDASQALSEEEEQLKSLPAASKDSAASFVEVQSYIESLRLEQSQLHKKLELAETEIKLLRSDRSYRADDEVGARVAIQSALEENNPNYRPNKTDGVEQENKCERLLNDYNLLLTACNISSALNHARHALPACLMVVDQNNDQPAGADSEEKIDDLVLQIEKLNDVQHQLEISKERLVEETSRKIISLEEKVTHLQQEGKFMKDQYDREMSVLQEDLKETRSRDENNSAHNNYLKNLISEIEHELANVEYISETERDLPDKIRSLLENETKYLEEISKNKEKEEAFRETLAEADIIMTNIENNYKTKVADLEEDNALLQQKLALRSETERFVAELAQSDKSGQNKILLEKLFQNEKTELNMIEKIFDLEKEVKEISQKVCDEKILKTELDNTTKDQELNIEQIRNLENENRELLEEMLGYKEIQFKYQELLQSDGYLRARIEELEIAEISLRDEFSSCEQRSGLRERRLLEEISKLRDEIKQINTSADNCQSNCGKPWAGSDENLKMEYDSVKERLRDLTCQLEEKSKIFQDTESSLRTEVIITQPACTIT